MNTFKITLGTGSDAVTFIERSCRDFAEAKARLAISGVDFSQIKKIEKMKEKTK